MSSSLYPRQSEPLGADDGLSFEPRPSLPTVIVKRSRLAGLTLPANETRPAADAGAARDPKVFRVAAAPPPERPEALVSTAQAENATPAPRRRKRDPLRAPVLLRHEVIAPPPAEAPPPPASADYRSVCEALEDLQRDLALVRQARRFKLTLV